MIRDFIGFTLFIAALIYGLPYASALIEPQGAPIEYERCVNEVLNSGLHPMHSKHCNKYL